MLVSSVLVHLDYCNKTPQTGWLINSRIYFSRFWWLGSEIRTLARWGSGEDPLTDGPTATRRHLQPLVFWFFMTSHIWGPVQTLPSPRGTTRLPGVSKHPRPLLHTGGSPGRRSVGMLKQTAPLQAPFSNPLVLGCRRQEIKSQLPQLISAAL